MQSIIYIMAGIYGSIVGSFLNVCIYRLPRDISLVNPPSHCPSCGKGIAWYDNLPLISYLILGGKCRHCKTSFSPRYLMVESITGCLFAYIMYKGLGSGGFELSRSVITAWICAVLVVATFVDIEFYIIPDEVTKVGMLLAPIVSFLVPSLHANGALFVADGRLNALVLSLIGLATGGGMVYFVGVIGKLIFRKDAMGFGDVKLMAFLGAILGWKAILIAFFLACFVGSFIGIAIWICTKNSMIPFGPYLSVGCILMLLFSEQVDWLINAYINWVSGMMGMQPALF